MRYRTEGMIRHSFLYLGRLVDRGTPAFLCFNFAWIQANDLSRLLGISSKRQGITPELTGELSRLMMKGRLIASPVERVVRRGASAQHQGDIE
jgi:hypothetical protein